MLKALNFEQETFLLGLKEFPRARSQACRSRMKAQWRLSESSRFPSAYAYLKKERNRKAKNLIKTLAKDLNRHLSKEDSQMDNKYEEMLSITNFREVQIKTTRRHLLTPNRMTAI